ncbi:MAG: 7-cyano-7-deazaguanine synthase QueC [bacterium]
MIDLPNSKNNIISILSGGLDSTILTYLLTAKYGKDKVIALTFNYAQRHYVELYKSKKTCQKLGIHQKILDIEFFGELTENVSALSKKSKIDMPKIQDVLGDPQPVSYVPYRNMLFITLALSFAESNNADNVFIGVQSCDLYNYWDTTPEFIDRINNVSMLNRKNQIIINAPFVDLTKKDEILLGNDLGVDFSLTHTCYNPDELYRSCGTCPSCAERIKNFIDAGMIDPIEYQIDINW